MTKDGSAWIGDQVRDENAQREGIVTDVQAGTYVLRPVYGTGQEWTADSAELLTVTVPRENIPPER
ncbi:hypothetical protein [Streptomyces sp. NPDC020917]|uniref:hypothetical protein n=1 Tax=Streptomyces sp. NPDC020917 TaxID=3365102 RepID=UPI0037A289DA